MGKLGVKTSSCVLGPFSRRRLLTEVRTILEEARSRRKVLSFGNLMLGPGSCRLLFRSGRVLLAPGRFTVVKLFLKGQGGIFSESRFVISI